MVFVSPNAAKALVEMAWLAHTACWVAVVAAVMVTGLASTWGDEALMALGVALCFTTWAIPFYFIYSSFSQLEMAIRSAPRHRQSAASLADALKAFSGQRAEAFETLNTMFCGCVALSFGMNYFQTPFFFDVLHMKFGFKATWVIDRNPIFLYFLTVPYFATYTACGTCFYRLVASRLGVYGGASFFAAAARGLVQVCIAVALAFAETLLNDNPFISNLFCYDDKWFALTFGSACYAISFILAFPVWLWIGVSDSPRSKEQLNAPAEAVQRVNIQSHVGAMVAVVGADALLLLAVTRFVAPAFTEVVPNAVPTGGCLTAEPMWELF